MDKSQLPELINWRAVLAAPRYAGGHAEPMRAIFESRAVVAAEWIEEDYQGSEAFAYLFPGGQVAIITDYFGSCSGCDAWEDATDVDVKEMVRSLVNSARLFADAREAARWCREQASNPEHYSHASAANLVGELEGLSR